MQLLAKPLCVGLGAAAAAVVVVAAKAPTERAARVRSVENIVKCGM